MNVTTLHISAHAIKALALNGKTPVRQEVALPPGMIKNGLILQPETLSGRIKSLFKSSSLPKDRVICTINGLPFSYRMLNVPRMAPSAFSEAVLRTARQEMSISPDEMYLSWQAYPGDNSEYQVLVAGITRHPVDSLIKTLQEAGIRPWLMDLPHLALARLSPHKNAVIIDFEKDCSNIVMLVDGMPRGMHMVPAVTDGASLQDQVEQVTDKLNKMIDFYNSGHPVRPIKDNVKVLVTGGLLDDAKANEYIKPQISYPVEYLSTTVKTLSGWPLHQYAVNAGSGLLNLQPEKDAAPYAHINLEKIIRDNRPKTDVKKSAKKILVPFMLVAGVSLLAVSLVSQHQLQASIATLKADLNRANNGLVLKQQTYHQAVKIEDEINRISVMAEGIMAGQQEMFTSRDYMSEISSIVACMPSGLTFNTLEINSEQIIFTGISPDAVSVIKFADKLESLGSFPQAIIKSIDRPVNAGEVNQIVNFKIIITRASVAAAK